MITAAASAALIAQTPQPVEVQRQTQTTSSDTTTWTTHHGRHQKIDSNSTQTVTTEDADGHVSSETT
jgi:hypothetical protein